MCFIRVIILCLLLSSTAFAHENIFANARINDPFSDDSSGIISPPDNHFFMGFGAGVDALSFSDRVNILVNNVSGSPADTFQVNSEKDIGFVGLIQLGWQWMVDIQTHPIFKLALEYDYLTDSTADGTRQDLNFVSSNYSYSIKRQALLLVGKLNLFHGDIILPYIEGGAGIARVTFSNFQNPGAPSATQPFPNKTNTNFAAILGLGLDMMVSNRLVVGLGYRFAYWNNVKSGDVTVSPGNGALPQPIHLQNELYSNEGLLTFSFLF